MIGDPAAMFKTSFTIMHQDTHPILGYGIVTSVFGRVQLSGRWRWRWRWR
jgi:hypothetical protein